MPANRASASTIVFMSKNLRVFQLYLPYFVKDQIIVSG